ncbi:hypothetical protein MBCUT_20510 [Methanobrevibacter cuticularis]|uniref:Right handed beta helix domain-containing protein n=1 Tax=Methanobrevibacter cuticularis TaxID=47311 RepID=A0A166CG95_9EURY|nr:right-handed parallel beta-helix repeat-containing protein [Methanobrevibacter cuticularis]KZX14479.1 hypothetical protein MBCUT_20510 [Methanobrevibacter cuticularis]
MFIKNKRFMSFSLIVLAILVCFTLSGVSAGSYDFTNTNNTQDFQNIIDTDTDDELEINLTSGSYTNLGQINITRNATIQGKNNPVITGSGSGILFNITAPNVRIINLTIIGYDTAISSNSSDLAIMGNNITTNDISINLNSSGENLTGISIKDNVIVSSIDNYNYGAVYAYAPDYSGAIIGVSLINNNITANGVADSHGVRFDAVGCSLDLIFENNNITGTGSGVHLYADSSSNSQFTFTNNNITGTSEYGVSLYAPSSNNLQLTFSSNNIIGEASFHSVYLSAYNNNDLQVTFTNNNMTGVSEREVYLEAYNNNDLQVTFTSNNVVGRDYGVDLVAYSSSNSQVTFTSNNITGTSEYGVYLYAYNNNDLQVTFSSNNIAGGDYGVDLVAYSNNDLQATFTNNNITRGSYYAVSLYASSSNNSQVTFTNNNIVGGDYGVELYAFSSNNSQVIFSNNNITGSEHGVELYAYSSNNTQFIFSNNNITGVSEYGVWLSAYSTNNTNITFNENNITGGNYAVYVYSYNGNTSGIRFLNNTVNATIGDGFVFETYLARNISDFVIRGNNIYAENGAGLNFTKLFTGSLVNVTVEYNRIISQVGVNITGYDTTDSSFDYNWWGVNDIANKIFGIDTNNHYILNITNSSSLDDVHFGDIVSFYLLILNTTLNNSGVENLPDFVINGTLNNVDYVVSRDDGFIYEFAVPKVGNNTLNASLDAAYNITSFIATKASTNSTIVLNPNPAQIGEDVTVSGVLANHTGVSFVNVTVDGTLFNDVAVDGFGYWELNYTTNRTGTDLEVIVSFAADGNYDAFSNSTTFTVNKNSTNSTIVVNHDSVNIGENVTVSGVLANHTGIGFVNVTVDDTLFANVAVDASGYWELNYTTNRTGTDLEVIVSFAGNENYTSFTNNTSFNVTKIAVNSTINIPSNVKVGKTITIDGILVDENGNPVANAPITVTVDGKIYPLTTDSNGQWTLSYKPTHTGSIDTKVNYNGNDEYSSYTNTTTFNVVKGEAIVDIDVVKNPDGSVDVIVIVTDVDGDPIPDYKVSVDLDGKHIGYIVTDVFGVGRIHIPSSKLSDGLHVITATSDNLNYYSNPVSVEFELQNKNDTNNTNKTSNNPVAIATMKNTGMPIIAIILVLLTLLGMVVSKKED